MTRLYHISDVHFGREDRHAIDRFAEIVRSERPDAVVVTGDLTTLARRSEFESAARWLNALEVPVTLDVGNHDLPVFNPFARVLAPYRRFDRLELTLPRPVLPGVSLVSLKTTARVQARTNWAHGWVQRERLTQAVATLRDAPAANVKIVTCHHPLFDTGLVRHDGLTRNGVTALAALADAGADIVLSGHVHDPFDFVWKDGPKPLRLVGAGTLSDRQRQTAPSFNQIDIDGRMVHAKVRIFSPD